MKLHTLAFVAAAACGVWAGAASAMPAGGVGAAPVVASDNLVQDVRWVCNRYGRCWNTRRHHHGHYHHRHYHGPRYGYYRYPYRYHYGPAVGLRLGPFGLGVW